MPSACRRPNSTSTASPGSRSASAGGTGRCTRAGPRRRPRRPRPRRARPGQPHAPDPRRRSGWAAFSARMISSIACGRPLDLARLVPDTRSRSPPAVPARSPRCAGGSRARRPSRSRRAWSRSNRSSSEGGTRKTRSASAPSASTIRAPWTSILRIASRPAASASRTWSRGVPYQCRGRGWPRGSRRRGAAARTRPRSRKW